MPIYTKKEFASEFKIDNNDLTVYIRRGKVVMVDGQIDTANVINTEWCLKRNQHLEKKLAKNAVSPDKKDNTSTKNSAKVEEQTVSDDEKKLNDRSAAKKTQQAALKFEPDPEAQNTLRESFQTDAKLKKLNLQKTENEIALQIEKLQKIQGESVPTELVKNLFTQHNKSITVAYRNATDNLLMEIQSKHSISSEEMGSLRSKLIEIVNKAVIEAVKESEKGLNSMVEEWSSKKGVGERDG